MRLIIYKNGLMRPFHFRHTAHYHDTMLQALSIETQILEHANDAGVINNLSIDFAGQYVPIVDRAEARVVARLLAAYGVTDDSNEVDDPPMKVVEVWVYKTVFGYESYKKSMSDVC